MIRGYLIERETMCDQRFQTRLVLGIDPSSEREAKSLFLGDYLDVFRPEETRPNLVDTFAECCERAKEGDTNALSALPYMADRILSRAR